MKESFPVEKAMIIIVETRHDLSLQKKMNRQQNVERSVATEAK